MTGKAMAVWNPDVTNVTSTTVEFYPSYPSHTYPVYFHYPCLCQTERPLADLVAELRRRLKEAKSLKGEMKELLSELQEAVEDL